MDVYSFGIVLWELSSAKEPFAEFEFQFTSVMEDQILSGLRPTVPENTPAQFVKIMDRCWAASPDARMSALEAAKALEDFKSKQSSSSTKLL